jgi:hypothetical protein
MDVPEATPVTLIGLEQAHQLMEWLSTEPKGSRKRSLWVTSPDHPDVSFYGQAPEKANSFRVYIREGYPDVTEIRAWSVRYVGYQMGLGFESLDKLKAWLATCTGGKCE